jgi:hypothetical protein
LSNLNWTEQEEWRLAEFLARQVCDRAAGRREDECQRNYPRDVYFVGNLRARELANSADPDEPSYLRELISKLAPVAFGAEFRLEPRSERTEIVTQVHWACYYRIFPTLAQQREHQQQLTSTTNADAESADATEVIGEIQEITPEYLLATPEPTALSAQADEPSEDEDTLAVEEEREEQQAEAESPETTESTRDRRRARIPQDSLFIRFQKIPCHAKGVIVLQRDTSGDWTADASDLQAALDQEMLRAQQQVIGDPRHVRTAGAVDSQIRVPQTALESQADYQAFLQSLRTDVAPKWRLEVDSELRLGESPTECVVLVELVNASSTPQKSPNTEAFLFDTKASFEFIGGDVLPFELELAPRGFRYDRDLWGRGFNCSVERMDVQPPIFITTHTPIYRQMRYATRTTPAARFVDLSRDPLPTIEAILNAMSDYRQIWEEARQLYVAEDPDWEAQYGPEFDADKQRFEYEIDGFLRGCQLIRENADVRLAFRLTNETFRRGAKSEWRLFQIVFLVSQIPGIVALADPNGPGAADREMVDIIYFPTGGGKTEAYLATLVFHCFFDRLRGKAAGVTAWTRFPLRLLTLQQTQRVADIIGIAELVRREQRDRRLSGRNVDGFAVGYFVGEGGSPNEIVDPTKYRFADAKEQATWSKANDPQARQDWQRVIRCPSCRTATVRVDFDLVKVRVIHRCARPGCAFPNGEIPVYVVDNEIYRFLPCAIVGTIDKLAGLGNQRKLAQIFGQADGRCTEHGYYKGKCCQKDCNDAKRLRKGIPQGLSGPTLFVQDELHLLKEGLGTFDAHYETFTQLLRRELGQAEPLKVIASSATIEAFARQVEHLYGRDPMQARVFPGLGPRLGQSFYAETLGYPQRLFVGFIPHNKTIFNTILELIEYYHREVQSLQLLPSGSTNPFGGALTPGTPEWRDLLDYYATSLTYFLSNRELNSIHTDLEGHVNHNLERDRLTPLGIAELTGSTGTNEVTRILERLEGTSVPITSLDAVLATSMVSHGVDVDRFNAMIFYGMPRQNAEYIQASSRVGRAHVGIIFNCLHPARERDQSHYAYFVKFHEFLGQLVEPVAINRWSKFSVNRTLPGLFMGVLLQLIANRSGESNPNQYYMLDFAKRKISDGSLRADNFIALLEQAYRVQAASTTGEMAFREEIRLRVQQFLDGILGAGSGRKFVSEVLIPKPMRSLRDVDEAIDIELDSTGSQWAAQAGRRP